MYACMHEESAFQSYKISYRAIWIKLFFFSSILQIYFSTSSPFIATQSRSLSIFFHMKNVSRLLSSQLQTAIVYFGVEYKNVHLSKHRATFCNNQISHFHLITRRNFRISHRVCRFPNATWTCVVVMRNKIPFLVLFHGCALWVSQNLSEFRPSHWTLI